MYDIECVVEGRIGEEPAYRVGDVVVVVVKPEGSPVELKGVIMEGGSSSGGGGGGSSKGKARGAAGYKERSR